MSFNPFKRGGAAAAGGGAAEEAASPPAHEHEPQGEAAEDAPPPPLATAVPPSRRAGRHIPDVGIDCLRPCRVTWHALMRGLATTKTVTGVAVALPCVYLIVVLAIANSPNAFGSSTGTYYALMSVGASILTSVAQGVGGVIGGLTFLAGLVGGLAVWGGMQNLLGIAAYVYTLLGHWFIITCLILVPAGYSVFQGTIAQEIALVGVFFAYVSPPILIYLLSAGVMDAHRVLINDRIVAARTALAAAVDEEAAVAAAVPMAAAAPGGGGAAKQGRARG